MTSRRLAVEDESEALQPGNDLTVAETAEPTHQNPITKG